MTLANTWTIFRRDVAMGPRGFMAIWMCVFPLLITFVVRLIFGGLIDPSPRLGIVDLGSSSIPAAVAELDGIELTIHDTVDTLKERVEANNLDAGLVLRKGFDDAVLSGESPDLELYGGGQSLASTRVVLAVTVVDVVRSLAGEPVPVEVETAVVGGGPSVPIEDRIVPLLVLLAVALGGIFFPASMVIQEKLNHTADAVLTTTAEAGDFFFAKGFLGFLLSFGVGVLTLIINGGFTRYVGGNLVVIAVGALMCVQLGLILGALVKDQQTMFSIWKGGGIILFAPAILFLFPSVPEWIAKLFPTYYFLGPLHELTVNAAPLKDVTLDLIIGVVLSGLLMSLVVPSARKMERKLALA